MRTIQVQKLDNDSFRKYGSYQDLFNNEEMDARAITGTGRAEGGFYADLLWLDFARSGNNPTISMCHIKKKERNIVSFLEYHQYTCEGLLPLDDDIIIFVGSPGRGEMSVDSLESFLVPKGTFVKLNPLVVHGTQFPVNNEEAHVICMLPGRTFRNDMIAKRTDNEEEMAELVL